MKCVILNSSEILLLAFLAITFLQSGTDKIVHWKGNLAWLKEHFSKTFLKGYVPPMLFVVMVAEVLAGALSAAGIFQLLFTGQVALGYYGAVVSGGALLMLLFGQRIAKDYEGAKTIAVYFIVAVFAVFLLSNGF